MSNERKIRETMAVVETWFEWVKGSIIESGGNPDDGEFYDYVCEVCGGPCVVIVHSGDSFSLSPGGKCCQSLIKEKRRDLGLKIEEEASVFINFHHRKVSEGPKAFMARVKKQQAGMS